MVKNKILLFFISLIVYSLPAAAEEPPVAAATLLSEKTAISPGQTVRLGVKITPSAPGWHTYWQNPGDAGLATDLAWTLPEGFSAGNVDWPTPVRIMEGPLAVYGYEDAVFLPVSITAPAELTAPNYEIKVKASWLICKDICIPESADLSLSLPAGAGVDSADAPIFARHDSMKPTPVTTPGAFKSENSTLYLSLPLAALGMEKITQAEFLSRGSNAVRYAAEQTITVSDDTLNLNVSRSDGPLPIALSGLLKATDGKGTKVFDVVFMPAAAPQATAHADTAHAAADVSLLGLLLLALMGGLVLNLMPCVLPVLSLKALAVVKKIDGERKSVRMQGFAYTFGILLSFSVVAGLLLALKAGGESIGWGFQMQSPAFVGFLTFLLFLVGLNLSGLFHLPVLLGNIGGSIANESSARGSFLTGVLATAVATPCTAPFMASAVGVGLTLPAWQSLLIFEMLALGLALPFLLISLFPAMLRFLPKPGAWMETLKKWLALPMYLSVLWLLWVLWQQTGTLGVGIVFGGMVLMFASLWIKKLVTKELIQRIAVTSVFLIVMGGSMLWLTRIDNEMPMPSSALAHDVDAVPFSKEALDKLLDTGKPVFVDATAAWCITCQLNARVAINTERTMALFKERGITLVVADWTKRNAEITEFLASFGYQGVPLYVYYPGDGGEPKVLPQLLTESIIAETVQ